MRGKLIKILLAFIIAIFMATACAPSLYDEDEVTLRVEIAGDIKSFIKGQGMSGYGFGTGGLVFLGGSSWVDGKGVVRAVALDDVSVLDIRRGDIIIIKTEELKFLSLIPGDVVAIGCYIDVERVKFTMIEAPELDECRMLSPVVERSE